MNICEHVDFVVNSFVREDKAEVMGTQASAF